jgi:hypothetical protein
MTKHEPSPWPFETWTAARAARDAARAIRAAAGPDWTSDVAGTVPDPYADNPRNLPNRAARYDAAYLAAHPDKPAAELAEPDSDDPPTPDEPDAAPRWRIVEPLTGATLGTVDA